MKYFIPIILGTGRKGAKSEKVAEFVYQKALDYGFDSRLIKPRDWLDSPFTEEIKSEKLKQLIELFLKANGFIIVSPEYFHFFPGELKILLDSVFNYFYFNNLDISEKNNIFNYKNKPVGICSVSEKNNIGGVRMGNYLQYLCIAYYLFPLRNIVYFFDINNFEFNKNEYKSLLIKMFSELNFYCQKLK